MGPEESDWIPSVNDKGDIILTAEAGDNLKSLNDFFGSSENAQEYVPDDVYSGGKIEEGTEITLKDSNYSDAFKHSLDPANAEKYRDPDAWYIFSAAPENYNCFSACLRGSAGLDFDFNEIAGEDHFNNVVKNGSLDGSMEAQYKQVNQSSAQFGKTVIPYTNNHSGVYFGTSKNGTVHTFTKPGKSFKPQITKSTDVPWYLGSPTGYFNFR